MSGESHIRAGPSRDGVVALLELCDLPSDDLTDDHMRHFLYAGLRDVPSGVVGVELCGKHALLRSLAVRENERGRGLGIRLVQRAERYARARGTKTIYLLTTTAERFFARRGYASASRDDAPEGIRNTREFAHLCPASSVFMCKQLGV
jgi:amino-acid N-acetyltransferase